MPADDQPVLSVLTLLYDPAGSGLPLFRRCRDSVLGQRGIDLRWVISVSAAAPDYEPVLAELATVGRAVVRRQVGVSELGDHLTRALPLLGSDKSHLLCHDDAYAGPGSAARISRALDAAAALVVEPVGWTPGDAVSFRDQEEAGIGLRREPRTARRDEAWGINRTGGLSTTAWVGGGHLLSADPRYSLLADLSMRERMRDVFGPLWRLSGGLVTEARWPGQSQYALAGRARSEWDAWAADHGRPATGPLVPRAVSLIDRVVRKLVP